MAPTVIMVASPEAYSYAMSNLSHSPEGSMIYDLQRNDAFRSKVLPPMEHKLQQPLVNSHINHNHNNYQHVQTKAAEHGPSNSAAALQRYEEVSKAEVEMLNSRHKRFVATMEEEHKADAQAAREREDDLKEERATMRLEIADLKAELKAERKAHTAATNREKQKDMEINELRAKLSAYSNHVNRVNVETEKPLQSVSSPPGLLRRRATAPSINAIPPSSSTGKESAGNTSQGSLVEEPTAGGALPGVEGMWMLIKGLLESGKTAGKPSGAAASHSQPACIEAARKLISNHIHVGRDICNPSPVRNIHGDKMLTQLDLERVPYESTRDVDQFLREVAWRLLGGEYTLAVAIDPSNEKQSTAWAKAASYLEKRLQTSHDQVPGRAPDMSPEAAAAMISVMHEVAQSDPEWSHLKQVLKDGGTGHTPTGPAAAHTPASRMEAARKITSNHVNLCKDITNASQSLNIHGNKRLTQLEIERVVIVDEKTIAHVDQFLREVAGRLLGDVPTLADSTMPQQFLVWAQSATFLKKRLQTREDQCQGRAPDLSPEAAAAMVAVMNELMSPPWWDKLRNRLLDGAHANSPIMGAAAYHPHPVREEAARKLILDVAHIVKEVCNPSAASERVAMEGSPYVDQFLREVAGRLLGEYSAAYELRLDLSAPQQAMAWIQAAAYLEKRFQSRDGEAMATEEAPLSAAAVAAMVAVMQEVSQSTVAWLTLWQLLEAGAAGPYSPAEAQHRREAATKLIMNHGAVRLDICNPFPNMSIKGNKLSQARSIIRLPFEDVPYVDQFLREVATRLLGRGPSIESRLRVHLDPMMPAQARAWVGAAAFLTQRIQSTPQQFSGRQPDMSPEAAEAIKGAISEVSSMASAMLSDMTARGLDVTRKPVAAPPPPVDPTATSIGRPGGEAAAMCTLAMRQLTQGKDSAFQKWIGSKASQALLDGWNKMLIDSLDSPEAIKACCARHFGSYRLPEDMAGWLLGVCVIAESLPLAFVLSDAQTAGFPLIYINKKFTDVTGYTKEDSYGRNCRFLQGPATNPEHGKMLLDTLRNGQDSQIMMVNYRKSGEVFENLLTMAYLRDSHERRRYCVGLQLDLSGLAGDDGPWGQASLSTDQGRALIEETRVKYTKLIKLLPQTLPVPTPQPHVANVDAPAVQDGAWICPQLQNLANALGVPMPRTEATNWVAVLYSLLDATPHAATVCDMSVPGIPLDYINAGFTNLTGWTPDAAVGKNCRFLQDERTEALALAELINAIRTYTPLRVRITNVKKHGTPFVNDLSTHPIFDSNGTCRFMVGILADYESESMSPTLDTLRRSLPNQPINETFFPRTPPRFGPIPPIEQWQQFQKQNTKLIRLLWATEPDGALRQLLTMHPMMAQQAVSSFLDFLQKNERGEDVALLGKLLEQQRAGAWSPLAGRTAM